MERANLTICIVVAFLLAVTSPAFGDCTEIWVDQAAGINDPNNDPNDPNDAFKSITYALAVADSQGWPEPWCVYIRPGNYDADPNKPANEREIFPIELGDAMVFEGTDPNTCIIDGQHLTAGHVALLYGDDLTGLEIHGLTFRNMDHSNGNGGAIELINCSGQLENCTIEDCSAQRGGGMQLDPRSAPEDGFDFISCTFSGNTATGGPGGGLYVTSALTGNLGDCTFANNAVTGDGWRWGGGFGINGSVTGHVTGCTLSGNTARNDGGAGFRISGTLTGDIRQCSFADNSATCVCWEARYGGGFRITGSMNGDISGCNFINNAISGQYLYPWDPAGTCYGAGFCISGTLNGDVSDCTFTENSATSIGGSEKDSFGGGFYVGTLNGSVSGCSLTHNATYANEHIRARGGGFYVGTLSSGVVDCMFADNYAQGYGGGFYVNGNLSGGVSNSKFGNNQGGWGSAFRINGSLTGDVCGCDFVNDERLLGPEAVFISGVLNGIVDQCRFLGFPSGDIRLATSSATVAAIRNCLFVAPADTTAITWWGVSTAQKASVHNNTMIGPGLDTGVSPAALYFEFGTPADDSQVYNNIIAQTRKAITVAPLVDMPIHHNCFHDVEHIVCQGESGLGNDCGWLELQLNNFRSNYCETDPLFVAWPTSTWTSSGIYDPNNNESTFFEDAAAWNENELVGRFLNPDITEELRALIMANTMTTVTVLGDVATYGAMGDTYEITDYHLSDASPCVDTGDPSFVPDYDERDVDGQMRIRDGDGDAVAYVDRGADEFGSHCPGDVNDDGVVNLSDLAELLAHYDMTTGATWADGDVYPPDSGDGAVNQSDLAELLAHYGDTCP